MSVRRYFKHGHRKGREFSKPYKAWCHLRERCYNLNYKNYHDYGGRGISVCDEWREDFPAFYAHVGDPPSGLHSIDRIDNNGNYEPGNVRWTTRKEQSNNRRNNVLITHNGKTLNVFQWAEELGVNKWTLSHRIKALGWEPIRALTTPIGKHTKQQNEKEAR